MKVPVTESSTTSMSTTKRVNLISLACSAVASSIIASKPIRRIALNSAAGNICSDIYLNNKDKGQVVPTNNDNTRLSSTTTDMVGARVKADGTIVTDADGASQRIIVENLRKISKEIRIVGEESKEDVANGGHSEEDDVFDEAVMHEVSEEIHSRIQNSSLENVDCDRVSVFIDPLDGTKNYASGKYDSVTILIAIVLDNIPLFGVVCKPFGEPGVDSPTLTNSGCFVVYGGTLLDGAFIAGGGQCQPISNLNQNGKPTYKAVISKSRSAGIVEQCLHKLHSCGWVEKDPLYISGAGEKTLRLILGTNNESLWFFPKPGTSLWDVAAADALLTVVGGRLTDKYGNPIDYSKTRLDADNTTGIVACNNIDLHQKCIQTFNEGGWVDDV